MKAPPHKVRIAKLQDAQLDGVVAVDLACKAAMHRAGVPASEVPARGLAGLVKLTKGHDVLVDGAKHNRCRENQERVVTALDPAESCESPSRNGIELDPGHAGYSNRTRGSTEATAKSDTRFPSNSRAPTGRPSGATNAL